MNKKERRLALSTALQSAAGDIVVVDSITSAAGAGSWSQSRSIFASLHQASHKLVYVAVLAEEDVGHMLC